MKKRDLALAWLIPAVMVGVLYWRLGIAPFGNAQIVIMDAKEQYLDFFAYFKTILQGENNLLYTFSKGLGGDMIGLLAYYLMSPFNLVLALFDHTQLYTAFSVIVWLKIGFCGLAFYVYAEKTRPHTGISLLLSSSYALCGYAVMYFSCVMWLDGMMVLPLVILGLDRLLEGKKTYGYALWMAYAIISNYYMGYMIGLFTILYFLYQTAVQGKKVWKRLGAYVTGSLFAVGLSAVLWLPTLFSLMGGKTELALPAFSAEGLFAWQDFLKKFFSGTNELSHFQYCAPNVYVGMVPLVLSLLYFGNAKISRREKGASFVLLAFFVACFYFAPLNIAWHGFATPVWFMHRFSFLFVFVLLSLAMQSMHQLKGMNQKALCICAGLIILGVAFCFLKGYLTNQFLWVDVLALCLSMLVLSWMALSACSPKRILLVALLGIQLGMVGFNAYVSLDAFKLDNLSDQMASYQSTADALEMIPEDEYRVFKTFSRTRNDSMQFNYKSISHFSSCEKAFVKSFLRDMGFGASVFYAYYNDSTMAAESLLGIKYMLSNEAEHKDYFLADEGQTAYLHENPYALPLGFVADMTALEPYDSSVLDPFAIQNSIFERLKNTGNGDIFIQVPSDLLWVSYENVTPSFDGTHWLFDVIDGTKQGVITYHIPIENEQRLYAYFDAPKNTAAEITVNGSSLGAYFNEGHWNALSLGRYMMGEEVTVSIRMYNHQMLLNDAYFYYEDLDVLGLYYDDIMDGNEDNITFMSSSKLAMNVNVQGDDECVLFSVPFDEGWKATVDGEKTNTACALGHLLAVPVSEGAHQIVISFVPRGLILGVCISAATLILGIGLILCMRKKKSGC